MTAEEALDDDPAVESSEEDDDRGHLAEVEDGAGCTEIWEHLSERRDEDDEG